ncbi:serine/arginine repetitive matrix protein 1-like [Aquila chrysaetos chrysaetos]|uniref:serine/arginine repetitive matrix protein 1-like n=1 Tax=Aquila chrysaetos chrysaetos TaxID=223781 RepID=UPI0011771142|nr:serine/arginine repetitive matrix protein 1-like [Aquila chrysaetos chrysaetos]
MKLQIFQSGNRMFMPLNFSKDIPFQQRTVPRLGIPRQLLLLNVHSAAWKLRIRVHVLIRAGKTRGQRRAFLPPPSVSPGLPVPSEPRVPLHPGRRRRQAATSPPATKTCRCPPAADRARLVPTRPDPHPLRSAPQPSPGAGRRWAGTGAPQPPPGRGARRLPRRAAYQGSDVNS